jgi:undecaprenyl-diphosphatase
MLLLVLAAAVLLAATIAALVVVRLPQTRRGPARSTVDAAREVGEEISRRPGLRRTLAARLDPDASTGLLLTLALAAIVMLGTVIGVVAFLVRHDRLVGLDEGAAQWAHRHATTWTTDVLSAVTDVGAPTIIMILAIVLGVVETIRTRDRWIIPFLVLVVGGGALLTTTVKDLADRVRPALNPAAEALGPSFPSGHSSYAAAFFAAAALILGRGRSRTTRAWLAAVAAGVAVGVAATRVLLGVHWLSDVVAGLALGAAWFAVCSIAFGGRLLRFGGAVRAAESGASPATPSAPASTDAACRTAR